MEIKQKSSLTTASSNSVTSTVSTTPLEKQWIGPNKRLDRHTLGRIDAIAQVGLFAILTVASTIKLIGRAAILMGKTLCRMDTSVTTQNLGMDAIVAVSCFEKIFRSVWRVFSAPKLKDVCAIDAGKKALSLLFTVNHGDYEIDVKTMAQKKLKAIKAAYTSPTGIESLQKREKRKLNFHRKPFSRS